MANKLYWKHPEFGMIFGPNDIKTPVMQVAWPYVVKPKPGKPNKDGSPSKPRYQVTFCLDKGKKADAFIDTILPHIDPMLELFNEGSKAKLAISDEIFADGNSFKDVEDKYPYYVDRWVFEGRNSKPIPLYGIDLDENGDLVQVDASTLEGGMYCQGLIQPLITAHGLSFKLHSLRIVKDTGERIGGGLIDNSSLLKATGDEEEEEVEAPKPARRSPGRVEAPVAAVVAPAARATGRKAAVNLLG